MHPSVSLGGYSRHIDLKPNETVTLIVSTLVLQHMNYFVLLWLTRIDQFLVDKHKL